MKATTCPLSSQSATVLASFICRIASCHFQVCSDYKIQNILCHSAPSISYSITKKLGRFCDVAVWNMVTVPHFSGFNSVSSFVSSEESAGRGDRDCICPLNQETHRLSKQCASRCCWAPTRDFKLSLCAKGCWFILFSNMEMYNLGYDSSCLPYLIDVTLIRITLHQHDRWKSSGRTHTTTRAQMLVHIQYTRDLALYEQMESEVIFLL